VSSRRQFLSSALAGLQPKTDRRVAGSFVDDSPSLGHRLRDRSGFGSPRQTVRVPVVIAGGGIAGLSAAWRLQKRGFRDFILLEMNKEAGGNSRSGKNEISPYPWAAHYLPVPNHESVYVRELMEELGILRNGVWEERYLCHSPQERLFLHGRWQEGIEPEVAASARDRAEYRRFDEIIQGFRASGQFTVPMELGAEPSPLDRTSMRDWLLQEGFQSAYLHWYVDYACRDDYGARSADTSAWAGIHYFAGRAHSEKGPLTWAEGNGWIANRLIANLGSFIRTGEMVYRIERDKRSWRVLTSTTEYRAARVIFAAPCFLAPYLMDQPPPFRPVYSPWLTANLTLDRLPGQPGGSEPAWDNVLYDSPSLGYVVATHMSLRSHIERTVWTYYLPLADGAPRENRMFLLEKDWAHWRDATLNDLSRAHPDIRQCVSRIDIMRMGHAMARPVPGSIFSGARLDLARQSGSLLFANSDVSGFSTFEEAQYRGVKAADLALRGI